MKTRFEERGLTRAFRRANAIIKRRQGRHDRWTLLGNWALEHGRPWGSSPWDTLPPRALMVRSAQQLLAKVTKALKQRNEGQDAR